MRDPYIMLTSIMIPANLPIAKHIKACAKNNAITRKELAAILTNRGYYKALKQVEGLKQCVDDLKKKMMAEESPFLYGATYPFSAIMEFFSAQTPVKTQHKGRRREVMALKSYEGMVQIHESNGWLTLILESKEERIKDGTS